ncbi:MAG: pyruvate kinase [PVC group bacterium]|nr:pyruvate kinase [PVC group bacterium]
MKQYWNKTKVICTIGPACTKSSILKKMILSGMDVARFNFSHGKPAEQVAVIKSLQVIAQRLKMPTAILQDLPGPKIRIGRLKDDVAVLEEGQTFFLTGKNVIGSSLGAYVNNKRFLKALKTNNVLYLNDGLVKLRVMSRRRDNVICEVMAGGRVYSRKGVNCPGLFDLDPVTDYDLKCLQYGIKAGVDYVAVSFVQKARDIEKVKKYLQRRGSKDILVVAKIERKVAFENIDKIIKVSDAVMVARGDLGIEANLEEIPFLQKEIIKKCNAYGRPVITATQMLESMVVNPRPTRAEVTDIANAIIDGTDALMLSEETAIGKYPVKALQAMLKIASKTEEKLKSFSKSINYETEVDNQVRELSRAAVSVANNLDAKAIVVPTENVHSISWLSRLRPDSTIAGVTSDMSVFKKLILFWGVYPVMVKKFKGLSQTLNMCVKLVEKRGLLKKNDNAVILLTDDNRLFSSNIMEVRKV